eukprot:2823252-Pyramimonas_sp.AAC.1
MSGLADLFMASSREEEAAKKGPPPVEMVKMDEYDLVTVKAVDFEASEVESSGTFILFGPR